MTAVSGASLVSVLAAPWVAPAVAETTALPGAPSLGGAGGTVRFAVPPGVLPVSLSGRLTVPEPRDEEVSVLVGSRVAATVPAESADVSAPVSRDDVVDGVLAVSLRLDSGSCPPGPGQAPITLTDLTLDSDGVELAPVGVEDFWPDFTSRVDVVVPGRADDVLLEAGLNAVAALTRRYGPETPVFLSSASTRLPRTGYGQRILRLQAGEGEVQTALTSRFGLFELDLTGGAEELRSAVRSLAYGDDLTAEVPDDPEPALERSLADLGADSVTFGGATGSVGMLRVPQDAFGQQVAGLRIRATGTRSELPEPAADDEATQATPTVEVYVNDVLVDAQPLDPDDTAVEVDAAVDPSVLLPVNTVRFAVGSGVAPDEGTESPSGSADTGSATCDPAAAPTVTLDGGSSSVLAAPSDGPTQGLAAYPQNLAGGLEVAVRRESGMRVAAASDAGSVVSALQGAAAGLLDVTVVDADDFVTGDASGLIAGADLDDAAALSAPLQYQEEVDDARPAPDVDVDVTQLFSALEAAGDGSRDVLVLGTFGPGDRETQTALASATARAAASQGWNDLDGNLLVTTRDADPTVLTAGAAVARSADVDDNGSGPAGGWLAAAIAVLLLLLGVQVRRGMRLDRRARDAAEDVTA